MPRTLTSYDIFIASPGDLEDERRAFRDTVRQYNESEALHRGVHFRATGWEDTLGGVGRPQELINDDIRACDYVFLMLWNRWGSAPGRAGFTSGTEEEYHVAMESLADADLPTRQMVLAFKAIDPRALSDPDPQLEAVLTFRTRMEQEQRHLFKTFDSIAGFKSMLRQHLGAWVRTHEGGTPKAPLPTMAIVPALASRDVGWNDEAGLEESIEPDVLTAAWRLAEAGRLTEAEVQFSKSVLGGGDPEACVQFGRFLIRLGRLDQARGLLTEAIELTAEHPSVRARALRLLGTIHLTRGDLDEGERVFQRSLDLDSTAGNRGGTADAYRLLGRVNELRGELRPAELMYRRALHINQELDQPDGLADTYRNLGNVLRTGGDLTGAMEAFTASHRISEELDQPEVLAKAYVGQGNVLQSRGDLEEAEAMYRAALEIDESLQRRSGLSATLSNLGVVLMEQGRISEAEDAHRRSIALAAEIGKMDGLAAAYLNLGIVLQAQNDLVGAEAAYRESLDISERTEIPGGIANAYGNLGTIFFARGETETAEEFYRKSLELNESIPRPASIAIDLQNLGEVMEERGDRASAQDLLRRSLDIWTRLGVEQRVRDLNRTLERLNGPGD